MASHVMTLADARPEMARLGEQGNFVPCFRAWAAVEPPVAFNDWQQGAPNFASSSRGATPTCPSPAQTLRQWFRRCVVRLAGAG